MPDDAEMLAMRCWNLLANGMGGIDWAGLPLAVEWLGVTDVDGLIHRLQVIKAHKPPDAAQAAQPDQPRQPA